MKKIIWISLSIAVLMSACAGNYGKIRKLPPSESQALTNNLEATWENYDIRMIPSRALLLTPKTGDHKLLVGKEWVQVANKVTWENLVRQSTNVKGKLFTWFPTSGFRKIEDPAGNLSGIIIFRQKLMVNARVVDDQTMQLYVNEQRVAVP